MHGGCDKTPTNLCSKGFFILFFFLTPINLNPKNKRSKIHEKQKNSPSNYLHVGKRRKQLNQARHFCATNYSEGQGESKRKSFRVALRSVVEALQATPYGGRLLVFFTSWKTLTSEQFSIDWPTPFRLQSPTQSSLIFSPSC